MTRACAAVVPSLRRQGSPRHAARGVRIARAVRARRSNTAFTPDNYTQEHVDVDERGWMHLYAGRPCYDPAKVRALGWPGIHMSRAARLRGG